MIARARNRDAYEVEFLAALLRAAGVHRLDSPRPVAPDEQEWLLTGGTVSRNVVGLDATPARIVAPDQRWLALQKLWMSEQAKRNPLKRSRDAKQGDALPSDVAEAIQRLPMDDAFGTTLLPDLVPLLATWRERRGTLDQTTAKW